MQILEASISVVFFSILMIPYTNETESETELFRKIFTHSCYWTKGKMGGLHHERASAVKPAIFVLLNQIYCHLFVVWQESSNPFSLQFNIQLCCWSGQFNCLFSQLLTLLIKIQHKQKRVGESIV